MDREVCANTMTTPTFADPPSYQEQENISDELVQPATYVLRGRFVYAEGSSSTVLYELSRVIHAQGQATTSIEFQRLEYRVRTRSDGAPKVSQRLKHIYNLIRRPEIVGQDSQCLEGVSSKGLGDINLHKSPFPHSGFRAARLPNEEDKRCGRTPNPRHEYYFNVKDKKHGDKGYDFEWTDHNGNAVAEQTAKTRDDGNAEYVLSVAVPLTRRKIDGLVALWCLWLWNRHAVATRNSWREAKSIMEKPRMQDFRILR